MNRKIAAAVAVACILAALGSAGSIAYRVIAEGTAGERAAEADFARLGSILGSVRTASDLADPGLRASLASHFSACPTLLAAEVFERGAGTRWRMPADSPYALGESGASAKLPASTIRLSAPLASGSGGLAVDAVYVRVNQLAVFKAFRDALIVLAAFLALASIIMAIASRPRRDEPSSEAAQAASAAAEYQYETLSEGWGDMPAAPATTAGVGPAARVEARVEAKVETASQERDDFRAEEPFAFEPSMPFEAEAGIRIKAEAAPAEVEIAPPAEIEVDAAEVLEPLEEFEPDYLAHAEEAEEEFFTAREPQVAEASTLGDESEDEFDIPEIDFDEDERPMPAAFEAKLEDRLPEMDMPSDDWMSQAAPSPDEGEAAAPSPDEGEAAASEEADPLEDIEELDAIDLEPAAAPRPSGLTAEDRLAGRLATEIFQAASSGTDLSLVLIEHEELTSAVPEYADFAAAIADCFGTADLAFERGRSGFAVILPGDDSRSAVAKASEFYKKLDYLAAGDAGELQFMPIFIGLSSRSTRPVAADRLIAEADAALRKAKEDSESHIVAFRPDPERYKTFLASR